MAMEGSPGRIVNPRNSRQTDFQQQQIQQTRFVAVKLLPQNGDHHARNNNRQEEDRSEESAEFDLLIQQNRKTQGHNNLQRDVNRQENERIPNCLKEFNVMKQTVKIFQADPVHGRDDIPFMKYQNKRKGQRKGHEQRKADQIGRGH